MKQNRFIRLFTLLPALAVSRDSMQAQDLPRFNVFHLVTGFIERDCR